MKVEARGQRTSWSAQARLTQNRPHGRSYLWVNLKIKCVGRGGRGPCPPRGDIGWTWWATMLFGLP